MNRAYVAALVVLALLTLLSLALNAIIIFELLQLREGAQEMVGDGRELVAELSSDTFTYTVELDQDIPISTEIPISESFTVPINTVVPIDTRVVVPVDLGITTYNLTIPIEAVFPIEMEATVPVSQVMDVRAVVPLEVTVPIEVAIADTPLVKYLDEVRSMLGRVEEELERPIWPR